MVGCGFLIFLLYIEGRYYIICVWGADCRLVAVVRIMLSTVGRAFGAAWICVWASPVIKLKEKTTKYPPGTRNYVCY